MLSKTACISQFIERTAKLNFTSEKSIPSRQRKARTAFKGHQLHSKMGIKSFERSKYLSVQNRMELAAKLNLIESQVKTWYQNDKNSRVKEASLFMVNSLTREFLSDESRFWSFERWFCCFESSVSLQSVGFTLLNVGCVHMKVGSKQTRMISSYEAGNYAAVKQMFETNPNWMTKHFISTNDSFRYLLMFNNFSDVLDENQQEHQTNVD
uniref:Homeobox domain-containing protein n=1 Tax=Tetranychus urticae TaxID=32264 RepID=T1KTI6_TETUR